MWRKEAREEVKGQREKNAAGERSKNGKGDKKKGKGE